MEGFRDAFDHPHELIVHGRRDRASCHKVANGCRVVVETEWKRCWGAPCGVFRREGEAAWVLPRWLRSEGDTGLALKPPIAEVDRGGRLDGDVGQRQLSSHRDDEVQVTEMHVCARDLANCVVSHPRPDLECAKAPTWHPNCWCFEQTPASIIVAC